MNETDVGGFAYPPCTHVTSHLARAESHAFDSTAVSLFGSFALPCQAVHSNQK
jgi:hypothetical protein